MTVDPDSEALRLLRELVEVYGGNYEPEGRLIDMSAVAEKARVLLAALPPSDPPALDVEGTHCPVCGAAR